MMEFYKKVSEKIRREREARGWSQEEFANEIGMSPCHYGNIERGKVDMKVNTIKRIAKGFDINPSELLNFDDTEY